MAEPKESTVQPGAVILLSGGLDSATTLAIAREQGYRLYALSFDYGQRHRAELEAARAVAESMDVAEHLVLKVDLGAIGGSSLTTGDEVAKHRSESEIGEGIPNTYVPARNTIMLSLALGWAETLGARTIFIGANAIDYSGYPDCRPEYIEAFEKMANLATQAGVEGDPFHILAPLISMKKSEIIRRGTELGVDYSLTHSCYDPDEKGRACGGCDSCLLRKRGFEEAGVPDPTIYAEPT